MQTTLLNEAWYNANKEAVHALNTMIGNLVPTQYDELIGIRGVDVSSLTDVVTIDSRGTGDQDVPETTTQWSARVEANTISNMNKVKTGAPFNAFYLDDEIDLHMMKAMTGFPNLPGEVT